MLTSNQQIQKDLELFEFVPGRKARVLVLKRLLPDIHTALFFGKALSMSFTDLSKLLLVVFNKPIVSLLFNDGDNHSNKLQDYLVETIPPDVYPQGKSLTFVEDHHHADFLPAFWDEVDVTIAKSVRDVALKLSLVLDALPSKAGNMVFTHMARLNRQRPTIGTYQASIAHQAVPDVLVILDVSGSMSAGTVTAIAADVVALGWEANAHLAIVSDTCFHWEPGTYTVASVLEAAEYSGTYYEMLAPLLDRDWGTVITIADYDSSADAKEFVGRSATGRIGRVLDLSLVNRPTYLSEVVGQLADSVEPLMVGSSQYVIK